MSQYFAVGIMFSFTGKISSVVGVGRVTKQLSTTAALISFGGFIQSNQPRGQHIAKRKLVNLTSCILSDTTQGKTCPSPVTKLEIF